MGICLIKLAICENCPHFMARTVKHESDNFVYRTEVLCETYYQCERAYKAKSMPWVSPEMAQEIKERFKEDEKNER